MPTSRALSAEVDASSAKESAAKHGLRAVPDCKAIGHGSGATAFPAGSVIVVPFPYSDRLAEKRRPALVISGPDVETAGFLWIAMITSARNPAMKGDLPIGDLGPTGLTVGSKIRPLKVACIEPSRVLRRIGALDAGEADVVYESLRGLIGRR